MPSNRDDSRKGAKDAKSGTAKRMALSAERKSVLSEKRKETTDYG